MAPHSSTLAWKIPWTEEPGRLQSMGSRRVGHDWATSLSLFTFMHWRRKWQPTPVLAWRIPGMVEPGGLPSMGSHGMGHNWSDLAAAAWCAFKWTKAGYTAVWSYKNSMCMCIHMYTFTYICRNFAHVCKYAEILHINTYLCVYTPVISHMYLHSL